MNSRIILKKLDRIDNLPTLPALALEVNKRLLDYDTSIHKLAQVIEKDQSIAARLLKLSNSSFYGFRRRISNVPNAVVLLGFNTIRNVVISVSVIKAFSGPKTMDGMDIADFWRHSVAVAMVSKSLGEQLNLPSADDCFLAGLLHDIGKIVLSQFFEDLFKKIWLSASNADISFYEAEKKEDSLDHAFIGGHLAKKWQLPIGLVDSIKYHHNLSESAANPELLTIVHTANIIVNTFNKTTDETSDLSKFHPEALKRLKPQIENATEWFPQMAEDIEAACEFFIEKTTK